MSTAVEPGSTFTGFLEGAATGIAGELTVGVYPSGGVDQVAIHDPVGDVVDEGGGSYSRSGLLAPEDEGTDYLLRWFRAGDAYATEVLIVTYDLPDETGSSGPGYVAPMDARSRSALLLAAYPPDDGDDALNGLLLSASGLVGSLTCRSLVTGQPGDPVPSYLADLAARAVVMKAEQIQVKSGTALARQQAIGSSNLASFTAGPYSESYFDPSKIAEMKALDSDPALAEILWALAGEDCRARWLELWSGEFAPAAGPVGFEWQNRPGGYGDGSWLGRY